MKPTGQLHRIPFDLLSRVLGGLDDTIRISGRQTVGGGAGTSAAAAAADSDGDGDNCMDDEEEVHTANCMTHIFATAHLHTHVLFLFSSS